jgi:hypothetical protein
MLNVAVFATAGSALADVHYVDVNSTNATPPYTNWVTAATNIQDAVDAAVAGDEIVVTNGTYATGARSRAGDSTPFRHPFGIFPQALATFYIDWGCVDLQSRLLLLPHSFRVRRIECIRCKPLPSL